MDFEFGPRRGAYLNIAEEMSSATHRSEATDQDHFEAFDLVYRSLCALLYNYVPMSGHPGGSISSGRIVAGVLFDAMDYDMSDPDRPDADLVSYAAGHKALGLYAMWALRDEIVRIGAPELLPSDDTKRLRLEDLLGFRRNPVTDTPLFREFRSKALDGHPTPATPFVRLATGASGVGVATSLGLALGARDYYGRSAPRVHIIEGEGGLTPGRVAETLATAGTARLDNAVLHVDWNQASIDSNHVCRTDGKPGDYVQWDPAELAWLHDWNVIHVPDGFDFPQVLTAQRRAATLETGQPTAIVYSTVKGWRYGIQGRASHGAGHQLCSDGFFEALAPLLQKYDAKLPTCCDEESPRCAGPGGPVVAEACFWDGLTVIRQILERESGMVEALAGRLRDARRRLDGLGRGGRAGAPEVDAIHDMASADPGAIPEDLTLNPGDSTTLRGELGRTLNRYNRAGSGAMLAASADLLGSTSVNAVAAGFPEGFFDAQDNPESRLLSVGGICEDAMSGILSGLSAYGRHIGVGSSYGAFIAALGHIAARLHAIGGQAKQEASGDPYRPFFLVCAHAGIKTGEDGPTHADPQPLQLLQENFPRGTVVTLTPWDPQEIWPLVTAALRLRPAVVAPFVTRPNETVLDREALGLAPPTAAATGVYRLRQATGDGDGAVVLQGSGVAYAFIREALPRLVDDGVDLNVYYVASAELFDALSAEERERIFPARHAGEAMGITGFTMATLYRWVTSERGRAASMHPFQKGHFLGSGPAEKVLLQAGMDGDSQYRAVREFVKEKVDA
jgi:transketolase